LPASALKKVTRIVLAGAGYTNVAIAPYIKQQLPQATVTLISPHSYYSVENNLPELLTGSIRLEHIQQNLEKHCKAHGVEFIKGHIRHIDRKERAVQVGEATVQYDILLLDLDTETDAHIPGSEYLLRSGDARAILELRQHVVTQLLKARNANRPENRTFVVVGAGIEGIEIATELAALTSTLCDEYCIFPSELSTILIEHETQPWHERVRTRVRSILEEKGIEYYTGPVQAYMPEGIMLGDRVIETHTAVWTLRTNAHHVLHQLGIPLTAHGAAVVNQYLQTADPHIFAVGDNASFTHPATHKTIPHTARTTLEEQDNIAQNIVAAARGKDLKAYKPSRYAPLIVTTSNGTALLIFGTWTWHGTFPYKIKHWAAQQYRKRLA
jgi:NADH:ubiquinone reductase (H+-translocating)